MSRTNHHKTPFWGSHYRTWVKRYTNKVSRGWTRQHVHDVELSTSDVEFDEILADWFEERGAMTLAMNLRNRPDPAFPGRSKDCW